MNAARRADEGLIVFAHGSRLAEANAAVEAIARESAKRAGFPLWKAAFLELAQPDLRTAARELGQAGARRVVVMPYFLVMGIHLSQDFPRLIAEASEASPGVELIATPALDGHPGLIEIVAERAQGAVAK